jgi:hypothetical protein
MANLLAAWFSRLFSVLGLAVFVYYPLKKGIGEPQSNER